MRLRNLFVGKHRKGIFWLPSRMHSDVNSKLETSEVDHAGEGFADTNEAALASDDKPLNGTGLNGQWRLRIVSIIGLIFCLLTLLFTLSDSFSGADSQQCRSIYMYPSYARIDGFDSRFTHLAQKYNLYLYREQGKDKIPYQDGKVHLDGVPVLFIPGNAGSFKQVRSIAAASSSLYFDDSQKIVNSHIQNLDFFAADFNEDFTAFHGRTMLDQAEYLNDAIRYILTLYAKADRYPNTIPTSVIVIGHSMGGVVARILPTLKNHVSGSVRTILTLSSPHAAAPVTFDGDILKIYQRTNDYWREQMSERTSFLAQNVSLVSLTGGILDLMLPADYTAVEDIVPAENGFTVYSTGVPGVWTPIDHLAVVWCDQLRAKIAKVLLEIVDSRTKEKVLPMGDRMSVFRETFLSGLEQINLPHRVTANFEKYSKVLNQQTSHSTSIIDSYQSFVVSQKNVDSLAKYSKFSFSSEKKNKQFSFLTSMSETPVLFCKEAQSDLECVSAAPDFVQVPASLKSLEFPGQSSLGSETGPFRMLKVPNDVLSKYDSVLIRTPSLIADKEDFILAALHTDIPIEVTENPLRLALFGKSISLTKDSHFVELRFTKLWDSLMSYRIHCSAYSDTEKSPLFQPFIRQWIEDPFETKWHVNVGASDIDINMHNVAPFIPLEQDHDKSLKLEVILPPGVGLKLTMKVNWKLTLKMIFIRYRLAFLSFPFAIACFTVGHQFAWYRETGNFVSFTSALASLIARYGLSITLLLFFLSPVVNSRPVQRILYLLDPVGLNRPFQLEKLNMHTNFYYLGIRDWFTSFLGVLFGSMSVSLLYLIAGTFDLLNDLVPKITLRLFAEYKRSNGKREKSQFMKGKRLLTCLLLIGSVNFYIPYQLATAICLLIQIANCIKIALACSPRASKDHSNLKNYNFAILLLLIFIVTIDAPTIIVFLHNVAIKWETSFRSHHNVMAVAPIIFLVSANSTFNIVPSKSRSVLDGPVTVLLLGYTCFFSLIYGARNLYLVHHLINIICVWLVFTIYANTTGQN